MDTKQMEVASPQPRTRHNYGIVIGLLLVVIVLVGSLALWFLIHSGTTAFQELQDEIRNTEERLATEGSQVTYTIEHLRITPDGNIEIRSSYEDLGSYRCIEWLKTDTQERIASSSLSKGVAGCGNSSATYQTNDPSSVRFLVKEGESFTLKPGMEKTLFEYIPPDDPNHKLTRYTIEILPYKEIPDKKESVETKPDE